MQRSLLLFENAIKTEASYQTYKYGLDKFKDTFKLKDYDSILKIEDKKLQEMVEDYIIMLKKGNPNSVRSLYSGLELFLVINDKTLNWKKIRKFFPAMQKRTGKDAWDSSSINKMLQVEKSKRNRAFVHFLASTGCRVGALPDLRLKHVKDMDLGCKAVLIYADSVEEYWVFLTPEASKSLEDYLNERTEDGERIDVNSPLFRKQYQFGTQEALPMTLWAMKAIVPKLVKSAKIRREQQGERYNIQADHGFRKRFNTILKKRKDKDVPWAITERLMGHRSDLDASYLSISKEELFEYFKIAIPDLVVMESERLRLDIELKEKKIQELQSDKKRITDLEASLKHIQDLVEHKSIN